MSLVLPETELLPLRLRFLRCLDTRVLPVALAVRAGVLLAHMMDALEVAGKILHLPAFLGADLSALQATAGTGAFRFAQLVNLRTDGKVLEVSQIAPAHAPLYTPPFFFFGLRMRRNIVRVNRLAVQIFGEAQQQLRQIARGAQTIRARPVIPLLISLQLQLYANQLNV
jgi:hypothetical protein